MQGTDGNRDSKQDATDDATKSAQKDNVNDSDEESDHEPAAITIGEYCEIVEKEEKVQQQLLNNCKFFAISSFEFRVRQKVPI